MGPVPARPISLNPELNFCSVFIFFDSLVLFTLSNILYCHYCISELKLKSAFCELELHDLRQENLV